MKTLFGDDIETEKTSLLTMTHGQAKDYVRQYIIEYLESIRFPIDHKERESITDKDHIRFYASAQRKDWLSKKSHLLDNKESFINCFASGHEIDPEKISPVLEPADAKSSNHSLFNFAVMTWSVSVSEGFGRRLKYVVKDRQNGRVIGVIGLTDPVVTLKDRDDYIGWTKTDRQTKLVNVFNAYVLGALPPYNMLLGGKLIACLTRSLEVYNDFQEYYSHDGFDGLSSKRNLLVLNTFSSMGRSSVYNRLKLNGIQYFEPIGYTKGFGDFHLPDHVQELMEEYCEACLHNHWEKDEKLIKKARFTLKWQRNHGTGSMGSIAKIGVWSKMLGFHDLKFHGIKRQIFHATYAKNAHEILRTGEGEPDLTGLLHVDEISEQAKARWLVPRSHRKTDWRYWDKRQIENLLQ